MAAAPGLTRYSDTSLGGGLDNRALKAAAAGGPGRCGVFRPAAQQGFERRWAAATKRPTDADASTAYRERSENHEAYEEKEPEDSRML